MEDSNPVVKLVEMVTEMGTQIEKFKNESQTQLRSIGDQSRRGIRVFSRRITGEIKTTDQKIENLIKDNDKQFLWIRTVVGYVLTGVGIIAAIGFGLIIFTLTTSVATSRQASSTEGKVDGLRAVVDTIAANTKPDDTAAKKLLDGITPRLDAFDRKIDAMAKTNSSQPSILTVCEVLADFSHPTPSSLTLIAKAPRLTNLTGSPLDDGLYQGRLAVPGPGDKPGRTFAPKEIASLPRQISVFAIDNREATVYLTFATVEALIEFQKEAGKLRGFLVDLHKSPAP